MATRVLAKGLFLSDTAMRYTPLSRFLQLVMGGGMVFLDTDQEARRLARLLLRGRACGLYTTLDTIAKAVLAATFKTKTQNEYVYH